jgi:hypothetical protein
MQPSRVADILMEQGRQAGRAREISGEIWGGLAQRLGAIPGEAIKASQGQKAREQEAKARQRRLDIDTEHLGMLQGDRARQSAADAKALHRDALTTSLVQANRTFNAETNHWETNHEAVANGLIDAGHDPSHYLDVGTRVEDIVAETNKKHLDFEAHKRKGRADIFGAIANAPEDQREARYNAMLASLPPTAKNDEVFGALPPKYPGHEAFAGLYEAQQTDAERYQREKDKADRRQKGIHAVGAGGLVQIDEEGNTKVIATGEGKPKHYEQKSVLLRGKPAEVRFDPATGKHYDENMNDVSAFVKPMPPASVVYPRAAGDKLVKVEHKDPATGRTVIEWLPQSELRGQKFEKGIGATQETRLASAQAVNETGADLIAKLSDPAFAERVGPAIGRFNTIREFLGNPPEEFSDLAGTIESYSIANMGVHGMRSVQGAEHIKKLLDQKHTPQSLIAAIKGLSKFSNHLMEDAGRGTTGKGPDVSKPPAAAGRTYYNTDGTVRK